MGYSLETIVCVILEIYGPLVLATAEGVGALQAPWTSVGYFICIFVVLFVLFCVSFLSSFLSFCLFSFLPFLLFTLNILQPSQWTLY